MTNLTNKFEDLRAQLTAQHNAVIAKIGANTTQLSIDLTNVRTRLDTIIEKLNDLKTTVTNTSAVDAILALRGEGPENTIKSLNQSVWNLVGPAPGATLVEILAALTTANGYWSYGAGIRPYNLLDAIYTALVSGNERNYTSLLQKIIDTLGDPSSTTPETYTVRYLLYLLLQQFDTSVVTPTIKDILLNLQTLQTQLAANPLTTLPVGVCDEPFTSTYTAILPVSGLTTTNITVAGWDFSQTTEFERGEILGIDGDVLIKTTHEPIDWSGYRFYVASKAQMFGAAYLDPQRWPTNQWITLPYKQSLSFTVDGDNDDLKVYICGASSDETKENADPGSCTSSTDKYAGRITNYVALEDWDDAGTNYTTYAAMLPGVSGFLESEDPETGVMRLAPAFIAAYPSGWVSVCLSWDFTGNTIYARYGRMLTDSAGRAALPSLTFTMPTVGRNRDEMKSSDATTHYISYRFAAPTSLGIPTNVFVHIAAVSELGHPL